MSNTKEVPNFDQVVDVSTNIDSVLPPEPHPPTPDPILAFAGFLFVIALVNELGYRAIHGKV